MERVKISFDYDSTLNTSEVQNFFNKYFKDNELFEVFIVTTRYDDEYFFKKYHFPERNAKVFRLAKELGIKKDNIIFTNMKDKVVFFEKNNSFLFHLDDDLVEIDTLRKIGVNGVLKDRKKEWEKNILSLLHI